MDEKKCLGCGGPVQKPKRGPTGDYCSAACKQRAYRRRVKADKLALRAEYVRRMVNRP